MFAVTRIYSDARGESHFEDIAIPLNGAGPIGALSESLPAGSVIFREVEPAYDWDFHNVPQRQYIILLDGQTEIETSGGETRVFGPGEVLLVEDTTGKGHRSRNLLHARRRSIFITIPEEPAGGNTF